MEKTIRIRLIQLGKRQVDLLAEIRKRGYPKLQPPTLCQYINGRNTTPQAEAVLKIADDVLNAWENETA